MIEFEKPNIECLAINEDESYGKFVCEPVSYTHLTLPTKA